MLQKLSSITDNMDRWLQVQDIAQMFGLSEESIKRLANSHGLPLRRVTPFATPGAIESELFKWLKAQPRVGAPVRHNHNANKNAKRTRIKK
jgi:hypothetical protein